MDSSTVFVNQIPEFADIIKTADHVDVKTVETEMPLRHFIAGMLSYQPDWITFLYRVRWVFVRLLGMKQEGIPHTKVLTPTDISMTPGDDAYFFTVTAAVDEQYWLVAAVESHLTGYLGVVVEPLAGNKKLFHVITIVHYNSWAGPVYFNVIRPFHHIVVQTMINAALTADEPHFNPT